MKKLILSAVILLIPVYAMADRTVTVMPSEGKITVSNPSMTSMNFAISCRDGSGIITYDNSSVFLGNDQTFSYNLIGGCRYQSAAKHNNGMEQCLAAGGANRQYYELNDPTTGACNPGYHMCSYSEFGANKIDALVVTNAKLSGYYAIPFYTTIDNWTTNYFNTGYNFPVTYASSSSACNSSAAASGAVTHCYYQYDYDTTPQGTMCCPSGPISTSPGFCKITVYGNGGHLVSPGFKGGTPF